MRCDAIKKLLSGGFSNRKGILDLAGGRDSALTDIHIHIRHARRKSEEGQDRGNFSTLSSVTR